MSTLGQKPATQHVSTEKQSITGNGGTSYTLQQSVSQASDIEVFVNNTRQEPTVAYTANNTTLTMTGAVNSSDSFYVIFQGKAIQTAGLPVDAAITASTISTSQTITSTGNITTSGTVNTPSINGGQIGGRRNLVINGAMQVAQRGTSFTGVGNGDNAYFLDRFQFLESGTPNGVFTITQASDGPAGFANSMKVDCTTAETAVAANERIFIQQKIEGQNLQHLKKGTSSAEKVTLSFHVKSNLTGTAVVQFYDTNNSRTIAQSYTIDSANTWEKKTITFDGDTTGALINDSNVSVRLEFYLQAGSDFTSGTLPTTWQSFLTANSAVGQTINVASSTDNNFYLTGVQLEVGSQATPFEHRSFGEELSLCQRYYYHTYSYGTPAGSTFDVDYAAPIIIIGTGNHGMGVCNGVYPVEMRSVPTVSFYSSTGAANRIRYWGGAGGDLTYGTVNRSTRQILGMSLNAGSNPEDFYSSALVCDAEL